jgi:hypothetical protein
MARGRDVSCASAAAIAAAASLAARSCAQLRDAASIASIRDDPRRLAGRLVELKARPRREALAASQPRMTD